MTWMKWMMKAVECSCRSRKTLKKAGLSLGLVVEAMLDGGLSRSILIVARR